MLLRRCSGPCVCGTHIIFCMRWQLPTKWQVGAQQCLKHRRFVLRRAYLAILFRLKLMLRLRPVLEEWSELKLLVVVVSSNLNCRSCGIHSHSREVVPYTGRKQRVGQGPTAATLSKARFKLDAVLMKARRRYWSQNGFDSRWISLSYLTNWRLYRLSLIVVFCFNSSLDSRLYSRL